MTLCNTSSIILAWFRVLTLSCTIVLVMSCGKGEAGGGDGSNAAEKSDSTKDEKDDKKKKFDEGVPVKVSEVALGKISNYVQHTSTIEAEEATDVYAQATGLVSHVIVEEGDHVEPGQILAKLVDDELRLGAEEARVNYQKLSSKFKRAEGLFERNLMSREDFEQQRFTVEEARIRWDRSKLSLSHASVRSPVAGVVAERMVKLGDRISPSNKLFSLVDLRSLIAQVHVPGRDMRYILKGQEAKVTTDFLPGDTFKGRVERISPVVDPRSGTFKVTLELNDETARLRPGMFITAHIVTATHEMAVLVPKKAIVYDDGFPHVFVVSDSIAVRVRLDIGFEDGENFEILAGIRQGDWIVIVGQNGLKDQAKIRVIDGPSLRIPAKPDSNEAEQGSLLLD
ncbi:MAG: efflux RND transporter periplasmic adaptor subunit [Candidatus Latescibacterota bacterium]|nr:efflux RND transporter periplasmic adaptor subunit [Candidatus Latescibacterota bacterium]